MTKWIAVAAVAGLALTGCGRGMDAERIEKQLSYQVENLLDDVDATPAQRGRAEELKKQILTDLNPLIAQSAGVRTELFTQLMAPAPDKAKMHGAIDAQFDSMRALSHKLADATVEFLQLLTPEQRAKVNKRLERRIQ